MSGIINKVKEAVTGHPAGHKDHAEHTSGPHNTDTANRIDPKVDSDNSRLGHGSTTGIGIGGTHTGTNTGYGADNTSAGYGQTGSGYGSSNTGSKLESALNTNIGNLESGPQSYANQPSGGYGGNTAPVHRSNAANELDPRVNAGETTGQHGHHHHHEHGQIGEFGSTGFGTAPGTTHNYESYTSSGTGTTGTTGHSSNLANKLDPRVDSTTGTTGGYGSSNTDNYGSNTGIGGHHGTHSGTGITTGGYDGSNYGSTTGGNYDNTSSGYGSTGTGASGQPVHKSNLLNKLDPRVDSDGDGRKGVETGSNTGSRTHEHVGTGYGNTSGIDNTGGSGYMGGNDSYDAAKVPPSEFQGGHGFQGSKSGGGTI